jgi:hypothetical protein
MAAPKTKTKNGGAKPGGGRPLGSRNQLTIDVKKAIIAAFEKAGGERWLATLARDEPRTFATLLAKIVPSETINENHNYDMSQLAERIQAGRARLANVVDINSKKVA